MSLETQIASLVNAANTLTNSVNGKMGEIDEKVSDARSVFDQQVAKLKSQLPRLSVTKNFTLADVGNVGRPDSFGYHAELTWSKVKTISNLSEAGGRPAADIDLLAEIERDVREIYPDFNISKSDYFRLPFTIWQTSWAALANPAGAYLAFPTASDSSQTAGVASVPLNSFLTVAGFVKVVDGDVGNSWANGAVKGKWRWCSAVVEPLARFGGYTHLHPMRYSTTGVIQFALVGACTGVVENPAHWGAMMGLG